MDRYITAAEFARISNTSKRTIQYYDQLGILKPAQVSPKGYRLYEERQVLEYQMILFLTNMGIPLNAIAQHLHNQQSLISLFAQKTPDIEKNIRLLEFNLRQLKYYTKNLAENGTLVAPRLTKLEPFFAYYIERTGPYAKIGNYCRELADMFSKRGRNFTTMAIFQDSYSYQPLRSTIKIAAIDTGKQRIKTEYANIIKHMRFSPGNVISYTHRGAGSLLSLFWKELEKYCVHHTIHIDRGQPDFEIYRRISEDVTKQIIEIYAPITVRRASSQTHQ